MSTTLGFSSHPILCFTTVFLNNVDMLTSSHRGDETDSLWVSLYDFQCVLYQYTLSAQHSSRVYGVTPRAPPFYAVRHFRCDLYCPSLILPMSPDQIVFFYRLVLLQYFLLSGFWVSCGILSAQHSSPCHSKSAAGSCRSLFSVPLILSIFNSWPDSFL